MRFQYLRDVDSIPYHSQPRDEPIVVKLLSPQEKQMEALKLSIEYPNDVAISGLN